jgi:hypothetical protein
VKLSSRESISLQVQRVSLLTGPLPCYGTTA